MGRWALLLLTAVAAWAAEPSFDLLSGDLFLLPPGPLELKATEQVAARAITSYDLRSGGSARYELVASHGYWQSMCRPMTYPRPSLDWLPAELGSREAMRSGWSLTDAQNLARAAARRLWPDFAGAVEVSAPSSHTEDGMLGAVRFNLTAHPHPDARVNAEMSVWPWRQRVVGFARYRPVVSVPLRLGIEREQAEAAARAAVGNRAPRALRGTTKAVLEVRNRDDGTVTRRWGFLFIEETIAPTGKDGLLQIAAAEVDADTGQVVEVLGATEGYGLQMLAGAIGCGCREHAEAEGPQWLDVQWTPAGLSVIAGPPARDYPWWLPYGRVAYVARPDGVFWWCERLDDAAPLPASTVVGGRYLATNDYWTPTIRSLADGSKVNIDNLCSCTAAGPDQLCCVIKAKGGEAAIELRGLNVLTQPGRCIARHASVDSLLADADGQWLAYTVDGRIGIARLAGQPLHRQVDLPRKTFATPRAWVRIDGRLQLLYTAREPQECVLLDPQTGESRPIRPPAGLGEPADPILSPGPEGAVLVVSPTASAPPGQPRIALHTWDVATGTVTDLPLPDLSQARPLPLADGRTALDVACDATDAAYREERNRQPGAAP